MHPETRITRGTETASRVTGDHGAPYHGLCAHCSDPVRGTRSTVAGHHEGRPFTATVCARCVQRFVQPGPQRRVRSECDAFWRHVGAYAALTSRRGAASASLAATRAARERLDAAKRAPIPSAHRVNRF